MLNEFEWCSLEAKEAAVRITLLYKISRHQIELIPTFTSSPIPSEELGIVMTIDVDLATKNVYISIPFFQER